MHSNTQYQNANRPTHGSRAHTLAGMGWLFWIGCVLAVPFVLSDGLSHQQADPYGVVGFDSPLQGGDEFPRFHAEQHNTTGE